jgi:hypothetical protein
LIYTESERGVRKALETKWANHKKLISKMTEIIRKYGLSHAEMASHLARKMGVERVEISGQNFRIANNDNVVELADKKRYPDNSVGYYSHRYHSPLNTNIRLIMPISDIRRVMKSSSNKWIILLQTHIEH